MSTGNVMGKLITPTLTAAPGIWNLQENQLAVQAVAWPGVTAADGAPNRNVLTMKTIGVAGATNNVFRDDSTNNFAVTRTGDVTQGTFSPYFPTGYWSGYFDGTGDYFTVPGNTTLAFGTGDFTIEFWTFLTNAVNDQCFIDFRPAGTNGPYPLISWYGGTVNFAPNAQSGTAIAGGTLAAGKWYHIAVSRSGTSTKMFLDGTQIGSTFTDTTNYDCGGNRPIVSGNGFTSGDRSFVNGYISNIRCVKGTALYTTAFTPPTTPLTAITNTSLLCLQDSRFRDNSTNNFTITKNGDTAVARFSPFAPPRITAGAGAAPQTYNVVSFDGTGDYARVPYTAAFDLSGSDWTMEAWFKPNSTAGFHLVSKDTYGSNFDWSILVSNSTTIILYTAGTATALSATVPAMNNGQWYHVAFVRQSGTNRIYLNGVQYGTNTMGISNSSQSYVTIGCGGWNNPNGFFNGALRSLRIVKGTAVYQNGTTFTPSPTLTSITNTSLLVAGSIADGSPNNYTVTAFGDTRAAVDVTYDASRQATYTYGGSGYFDGAGDYLSITGTSGQFADGQDFTIEGWLYSISRVSSYPCFFSNYTSSFANGGSIYFGCGHSSADTTKYNIGINATFPAIQSTTSINYGQWQHLALVRSAGVITLYVNGVANGTYSYSGALNGNGGVTYVGVAGDAIANSYINGYFSGYRIVKGTAVYTANFTPPTTPLTAISGTSLLLNFDNAGIYDSTGGQNLLTKGATATSTTNRKYEATTAAFNGTASTVLALPASSSSNFAFGTGDFTVEFWLYRNAVTQEVFYDQRPNGSQSVSPTIYCESATLYYYVNGGNQINGGSLAAGQWYHIAVSRASSQTRLFVNGTQQGATYADTNSYTCAAGRPYLGNSSQENSTSYAPNSYIEGLRVSRVGRYTAGFIPPNAPFA